MIKVGDICTIVDIDGSPNSAIKDSHGLAAMVTVMPRLRLEQAEAMAWVRLLEGPWAGAGAPCLVARLEKVE